MATPSIDEIARRVRAEYVEMPGLRLTEAQARRLWDMDADCCSTVLQNLVDAKFLHVRRDGTYARTSDGPLPLRMAKSDSRNTRESFAVVRG